MRPEAEYRRVLALVDEGMNDCAIGRLTGIPRGTVRDWRVNRGEERRGQRRSQARRGSLCPVCDGRWLDEESYAYLLGQYLGDGCISSHHRGVFRLRIVCDQSYLEIIDQIGNHMAAVRGSDRIGFLQLPGCVEIASYWQHWPCLFPQHGPGRKHERRIELTGWQQPIVVDHTEALLRGLIHSDGCRSINEVVRPLKDGPQRYRYPRYQFTNASGDIRRIFTDGLDRLGIHWTRMNERNISVARRADVAALDRFVGPKR
jgi:hypothetical protein